MPRKHPGYASRYKCPGCGRNVHGDKVRLGPFPAHPDCKVPCGLCGELLIEPPVGQQHLVSVWLNAPVHLSCKRKAQGESS